MNSAERNVQKMHIPFSDNPVKFYKAGLIEAWGRGAIKITDEGKKRPTRIGI